jgi:ASC-1-like (ASCH) protein
MFRDEYLVNIVSGRRTAQERVTGGRWRRIVQGDVLAEPRESRFPESRRVKSEDIGFWQGTSSEARTTS